MHILRQKKGSDEYETVEASKLIKRLDKHGNPVLNEVLILDKQIINVYVKLTSGDEDLTSDEVVRNLSDHNYVLSAVDESYIGTFQQYMSISKSGSDMIFIQKALPHHEVASIGFCPSENKWYGWSHRAICGFTIGDEVKEGDLTATSGFVKEYEIQHPDENMALPVGFRAKTLNDAKRMAIAFACAVH